MSTPNPHLPNTHVEISKNTAESSLCNYELLADLFVYPTDESYRKKIENVYDYLEKNLSEAVDAMQLFMSFIKMTSIVEMQELFLRSFDVQAVTTLDIGFILFGEDYKRGQLLAHLNKEHRDAGNDCGVELADHLPNVLRLLPKVKDTDLRDEIAVRLLLPAVVKMIGEFSMEKIEKKDTVYKKHQKTLLDYSEKYRRVYQTLLEVVFIALKRDFGYTHQEEPKEKYHVENPVSETDTPSVSNADKDFKQHIETEMLIEKE